MSESIASGALGTGGGTKAAAPGSLTASDLYTGTSTMSVYSPHHHADVALFQLDEIDEVMDMSEADDQHSIARYLKTGDSLRSIIDAHDTELGALREDFIAAHIEQAESICGLYNEFAECEKKLVDFEEEIVAFQRTLADTAEDIVKMQVQTDDLVRSVNNRKLVSHKINEVYSALQECDSFCSEISSKDVDKAYLMHIRQLESSIAFLSNNKQLEGTAVDLEMRPKLRQAAKKAGDKLQRYLGKKISAMGEDLTNISLQQQALEQTGHYAFTFLNRYNKPVADGIKKLYVTNMSEVFHKQIRQELREVVELTDHVAQTVEPLITEDAASGIATNRDQGSPKGNQLAAQLTGYRIPATQRRERSVSQQVRGLADRMQTLGVGDTRTGGRESTFGDLVLSLNAVNIEYNILTLDPVVATELSKTSSWMWRLTKCFVAVTNTCVQECQFIHHFFYTTEEEAAEEEESLDRAVLGKALLLAEATLFQELALVTNRNALLGGLRLVEVIKRHLCTHRNPIPLLLLSSLLEKIKTTLRATLHEILSRDQDSVNFLSTIHLVAFRTAPGPDSSVQQLLESKTYAANLGCHPIVRTVATVVGQLELLNSAPLRGCAIDGTIVTVSDERISSLLLRITQAICQFVQGLSMRHLNTVAQRIFVISNLYHIFALWQWYAEASPFSPRKMQQQQQVAAAAAGAAVAFTGNTAVATFGGWHARSPPQGPTGDDRASPPSPLSPLATQSPQVPVLHSSGKGLSGSSNTKLPIFSAAPAAHASELEAHLRNAIACFIDLDARGRPAFSALFSFLEEVEVTLGAGFFREEADELPNPALERLEEKDPKASTKLPTGRSAAVISEEHILSVVEAFGSGWQAQVQDAATNVHELFSAANPAGKAVHPSSRAPIVSLGRDGSFGAGAAGEGGNPVSMLVSHVLRQYMNDLLAANGKVRILVTRMFSSSSGIEAKLTNNTALLHEFKRLLGDDM